MSFSVISLLNPDLLQLGVRSLIEGIDKSIIQPEITEEDVAMAVARIRPNILVVICLIIHAWNRSYGHAFATIF